MRWVSLGNEANLQNLLGVDLTLFWGMQGGLAGVMALLEGDEFVRGILEPAGLTLSDVQESQTASLRRLSVQPAASAVPEVAAEQTADDMARCAPLLCPMRDGVFYKQTSLLGDVALPALCIC
jgi:hypothetical protein